MIVKKLLKYFGVSLLVLLVAIQFVPVDRENPPVVADFEGPAEVESLLRRACYDCHSNETVWPWYSYVAPFSLLVAHDVEEGREELNFSDWAAVKDKAHLIEEIYEETEEGEMPMPVYLITHGDAKVSPEEMELLRVWAASVEGKS